MKMLPVSIFVQMLLVLVKFHSLASRSVERGGFFPFPFPSITSESSKPSKPDEPPPVTYGYNPDIFQPEDSEFQAQDGDDEDSGFAWERSGYFEGDIMYNGSNDPLKNVLIDKKFHWPNAIVPFYIETSFYNQNQLTVINEAMNEFHRRTCVRFRPYRSGDKNLIWITGKDEGCFSYVGMQQNGGQQLNLEVPSCVTKGVVIHEMLHAVGFQHQQGASNRDQYVKINWENIRPGMEGNFVKHDRSEVTDYGFPYDYVSVMHYSRTAFSKNGKDTIESLKQGQQIGQRKGFSDIDLKKVNRLYNACRTKTPMEEDSLFKS